ncbi:S8 family peptidase [Sphingobacterium bambusae]|uniref:S8 family serine peptidase n=1 Tax=Sphingobacterium bambusae TaxID=662858 RepID=A0ABW6BEW3_9SPHI|nr:S8 family serine peptidase [Sphingobacterium bambusae]WPL50442.1 S8 family serine peptidase [Sphingobacterium bambusae]
MRTLTKLIRLLSAGALISIYLSGCNKELQNATNENHLKTNLPLELLSQEESYYWHGKDKIYFKPDHKLVLIEIEGDPSELADEYLPLDQTIATRIEGKDRLQIITSSENAIKLSSLQTKNNKKSSSYTAIKTTQGESTAFITNRISIKFPKNSSIIAVSDLARKYGLILIKQTIYGAYIFEIPDPDNTLQTANTIHENENVVWSNPDFITIIRKNTDTLYPLQYYLNNTGQGGGTFNIDINAPEAWAITTGCNNVRVAVIDDGIDPHDEFTGRLLSGFTAGSNNTLGIPLSHSSKGHGVNCAGIIGAAHNNGEGIKGIAPNSLLIPINIFPYAPITGNSAGAATSSDIATAIHWAWHPSFGNADVLSNSWGGGNPSTDITSEINNARTSGRSGKGSVVVFASGNGGASSVSYPSNVAGVIAVGAIDKQGNIWNYSNRGSQLSLVAPSGALNNTGDVVTTDRMGTWGYSSGNFSHVFGGTSAACPQVAGVAALILSVNPNLTEAQVKNVLQNTATDMGSSGFDNTFGYGRVNAQNALRSVSPTITGVDQFCSSANYTLTNLPSGASVSWSATGGATVSSSGNSCTLSRAGTTNMLITLTANITSACGASLKITKNIESGVLNAQNISIYTSSTSTTMSPSIPIHVVAGYSGMDRCNILEVQWEVSLNHNLSNGNVACDPDNGSSKNIFFQSRGTATIKARLRNNCGWSAWSLPSFITVN